jgi:pyridoxamine 5'-phosphate oxidase
MSRTRDISNPSSSSATALAGDESLELPEFDAPPADPIELLRRWFAPAEDFGVREPKAVSMSTVDDQGRPRVARSC